MLDTRSLDDDRVMTLVELALARAPHEREAYVRSACGEDTELFDQVWTYVQAEHQMRGFLVDPLFRPASIDHPFDPREMVEGRFRIVREVARGGMGVVYEAFDEKLERRVAIKCAQIGYRKWLPPEVRNAREISHPNVCRIFEIHTASTPRGEIDFITMEFLDGVTLSERLKSGALPQPDARAIALQLAAGLAEAHRCGVIHGDLKSGNVILAPDASGSVRAVITDFGLARRPDASPGAEGQQGGGTPAYMAPELWKGEKPSVASDIYALGIIFYEMVSGGRPLKSDVPWQQRLSWKPGPVDAKWDRILGCCLDPDPARRYRNAGEIVHAIAPPHSHGWLIATAAAAVLAAIALGIVAQRASAPTESVSLAIQPFAADKETQPLADRLLRDAAAQLARLRGNARTRFSFIPLQSKAKGTQLLHGTLQQEDGSVVLHAWLTDARTQVNTTDWTARYAPADLRYAPVALAGLVTETLHLPPLVPSPTVNAAAAKDYAAAMSYLRRNSGLEKALPLLEHAVKADPDSPLTHAGLAQAEHLKYFLTRDRMWLDRTTESLRQAVIRNPDLAQVQGIKGLFDADSGKYALAEAEYKRAIELSPGTSAVWRWLGEAYEEDNQNDSALASYRKAIEMEPGDYRNYQDLGAFFTKRSKYEEAAVQFRLAVDRAPSEPDPHFGLGNSWLSLGRFAEAENEYRLAIQLGETPVALHALGVTLMYQGRDREAIPYIKRALSTGSERYLWWMNLGIAYRRVNLSAESARANRRGLELAEAEVRKNPRNGYARSFLAYLCARLGDRPRAESEIAQALELSPDDVDVRWAAVLTYEALGQRENTVSVLSASPWEVIADIGRFPDVAALHDDPRYSKLLARR